MLTFETALHVLGNAEAILAINFRQGPQSQESQGVRHAYGGGGTD